MNERDRYDSLIQWHWAEASGDRTGFTWKLAKAQMLQESGGHVLAQSGAGAVGLFQLMPTTAAEMHVSDRDDPEESIRGGIGYLIKMWGIFKAEKGVERMKMALGSYNAGSGNIVKAQALAKGRGDDPSQWDSIVRCLHDVTGLDNSEETILYVAKIIKAYLGV